MSFKITCINIQNVCLLSRFLSYIYEEQWFYITRERISELGDKAEKNMKNIAEREITCERASQTLGK